MCEQDAVIKTQTSKFKGTIKDNILVGPEFPIHRKPINIAEKILEALKSKPDFIGQIDAITGKQNTYADMIDRSIKCALWLKKQGVQPGDIIGLCTDNNLDAIVVLLGIMYCGAICNTWDHELSIMTARYLLSLTSPRIIFTITLSAMNLTKAVEQLKIDTKIVVLDKLDGYGSLEDILRGHDNREITEFKCTPISNPDEVALIVLSSGTTGMPKATEISHSSMHNRLYPEKVAELKDHVCLFSPTIRWLHGVMLAFKAILANAIRIVSPDIVLDEETSDEELCDFVEKYGVTYLATDPFVLIRFVKINLLEKYRFPTLKIIATAGSIFSKDNYEKLAKKLPHIAINNIYGSTDAGGKVTEQNEYSKPGSVGYMGPNVRIKITDAKTDKALEANKIGEVRIKVPFVMNGYHKNPEATKRAFDSDGWLCTGDLGYYDDDGELFITGRISEFIIFRAINVLPAEIETVLQTHLAVIQAAVIGIPHEVDGEHPMAIVSLVPGETVTEQELISLIEKNLPDHCKLRAGIKILDKLPQTTTGKIAKKLLQTMFAN